MGARRTARTLPPALPNLLLTDYLEFRWFVDGKKRETFRLANAVAGGRLVPVAAEELERARLLLLDFTSQQPADIAPPRTWPAAWLISRT